MVSFVLVTEIAELKVELAVVIPTLYRNNAVFPRFVFSRNLLCVTILCDPDPRLVAFSHLFSP